MNRRTFIRNAAAGTLAFGVPKLFGAVQKDWLAIGLRNLYEIVRQYNLSDEYFTINPLSNGIFINLRFVDGNGKTQSFNYMLNKTYFGDVLFRSLYNKLKDNRSHHLFVKLVKAGRMLNLRDIEAFVNMEIVVVNVVNMLLTGGILF